jgi:hypothetical protein
MNFTMIRNRFAVFATALTLALPMAAANAQANLSITGGNGGQVVFTLFAPVQYTLTTAPLDNAPFFAFRGVGDLFNYSFPIVSGTMNWSVNGGPLRSLTVANSGFTGGSVTANDLYFFGPDATQTPGWLQSGDVITLWTGTLTTSASFAFVPPTATEYSTISFDNRGASISTDGVSTTVPEPSTYPLMAAGLAALGFVSRRRRRALVA